MALYDYDPRESSPNIDVEVRARRRFPVAHGRSPGLSPHSSPGAVGPGLAASLEGSVCAVTGVRELGRRRQGRGTAADQPRRRRGPGPRAGGRGRRHLPTSAFGDSPECLLEEN